MWENNEQKKIDQYYTKQFSEIFSNAYHLLLTNWSNCRNRNFLLLFEK